MQTYPLLNMHCASCAARVERFLNEQPGVRKALVNFAGSSALIDFDPAFTTSLRLREALLGLGYELVVDDEEQAPDKLEKDHRKRYVRLRRQTIGSVLFSVPLILLSMVFMNLPFANYLMWALATPVVIWFGRDFFRNALQLAHHRSAGMDTLVALSTGVSYLFSVFNTLFPEFLESRGIASHVYFEASAVVISFILLGRLLEEKAKGRTTAALKKLIGLQPGKVSVVEESGEVTERDIRSVLPGQILMVRPGEKIAVDGTVTEGSSYVDESMISGEPVPMLKESGVKVYAGTLNQRGTFRFRAGRVGAETMLAQIIRMVQEAQGSKPPVQKVVDKVAAIFVPVVMAVALLSLLVWMIAGGDDGLTRGFLAFVTVLVIACPCALGLATPTAIMVGIGRAAGLGILIRDAGILEAARRIDTMVLDKTGTLTEGRPEVTGIRWIDGDDSARDMLYSLEMHSEHPLAEAVTRFVPGTMNSFDRIESFAGKGVLASTGHEIWLAGNLRLLEEQGILPDPELLHQAEAWSLEARTVIWFAGRGKSLAVIAVNDSLKASSTLAVRQLQEAGLEVHMLTGDQESTARVMAAQTGILRWMAGATPSGKQEYIRKLKSEGKTVAMAGDGINDSAALAEADLSIAMGKGSDIAMEVAGMTIISSDLTRIPDAMKLSSRTVRTIRQNLFWAFIYNIIGIPVAAGLLYPFTGFLLNPMIAGAAMALSSVSVIANSLRLLRN